MKQSRVLAAAILASSVVAAPFNFFNKFKRDIVWVTDIVDVYTTVYDVETVWVGYSAATTVPVVSTVEPASTGGVAPTTTSEAIETTSTAVVATTTPTSNVIAVVTTTSSTSTSVYVAPTTSTYVAPTTSTIAIVSITSASSTTQETSTSITTSVASATSSLAPEVDYGLAARGTTYTGDITYYTTGVGSCGWTNYYDDHIVAISYVIMDEYNPSNPNNNPLCGNQITIQYGGSEYTATVVDTCEGCAEGSIDLSEGFFSLVTDGDTAAGRISGVTWSWT